MTTGWHADRFEEAADKLRFDCVHCGRPMWFPPSKHGKYKTCGAGCSDAVRSMVKRQRERKCLNCGATFTPRPRQVRMGQGNYCSVACTLPVRLAASMTPDAKAKRAVSWRKALADGVWVPLRGEVSPRWKGGRKAAQQRRDPVARAAARRAYLKANPHKAKEWTQHRRGLGRLPRGTVKRLFALQKGKCACCKEPIKDGYHLDHVMPLALGGKHEPRNLQLLCAGCNVRKSAKHPIDFMQSRGFLL